MQEELRKMLSPLKLLDLKAKALALNPTGRAMPTDEAMVVFQEMVWERILSLCFPMNLLVPYNDGGICKIAIEEECTQWYVKAPVVAKSDSEYIDIDSRLKEAFVFYFIAFLSLQGKDNNREEWEMRANKICLDYSCDVANMGLAKAKMTYELHNGITGVTFNCQGARHVIDASLMDTVVSCLLCGNVCTSAGQSKQLQRYKEYLVYQRKVNTGETAVFEMIPSHFSGLRALDIGVFFYLTEHLELIKEHGIDSIDNITTLSCELGKLSRGEAVADWVKGIDIQMGAEFRSIK